MIKYTQAEQAQVQRCIESFNATYGHINFDNVYTREYTALTYTMVYTRERLGMRYVEVELKTATAKARWQAIHVNNPDPLFITWNIGAMDVAGSGFSNILNHYGTRFRQKGGNIGVYLMPAHESVMYGAWRAYNGEAPAVFHSSALASLYAAIKKQRIGLKPMNKLQIPGPFGQEEEEKEVDLKEGTPCSGCKALKPKGAVCIVCGFVPNQRKLQGRV